ncbi:MAG TPA: hypothetical protein VL651_15035, partial [Bacteroidia bacterium]|nr:hypothetical protein [Bacteroidia bacterium]
MKKITRIFLFILSAHGMCAQNLVLNPGFEINRSSAWVTPLEYNRTDSWHQPSNGTSDIFSVGDLEQGPQADYIKDFDVYGGEAHPHSGTNFGGEIIYSQLEDQTEYREYMTGQLSQPLTIGTTYTVSFWMQLGKGSKYSISSIQIYLSAEDPGEWSTMHHLNFPPQLDLDLAEVNEQKGEWVKVSATFRSRANEKYFVIGNFRGDLLTKGTKTKDKIKHGHNYTYCYFDDFYVGIGDETNSSA